MIENKITLQEIGDEDARLWEAAVNLPGTVHYFTDRDRDKAMQKAQDFVNQVDAKTITNVFSVVDRNGSRQECQHTYFLADVFEQVGKTIYPEYRGRGVVVVDNVTSRAAVAMNLDAATKILDRTVCVVCGKEGYDGLCLKCRLTCNNLP